VVAVYRWDHATTALTLVAWEKVYSHIPWGTNRDTCFLSITSTRASHYGPIEEDSVQYRGGFDGVLFSPSNVACSSLVEIWNGLDNTASDVRVITDGAYIRTTDVVHCMDCKGDWIAWDSCPYMVREDQGDYHWEVHIVHADQLFGVTMLDKEGNSSVPTFRNCPTIISPVAGALVTSVCIVPRPAIGDTLVVIGDTHGLLYVYRLAMIVDDDRKMSRISIVNTLPIVTGYASISSISCSPDDRGSMLAVCSGDGSMIQAYRWSDKNDIYQLMRDFDVCALASPSKHPRTTEGDRRRRNHVLIDETRLICYVPLSAFMVIWCFGPVFTELDVGMPEAE
jgi:hypothetical protein